MQVCAWQAYAAYDARAYARQAQACDEEAYGTPEPWDDVSASDDGRQVSDGAYKACDKLVAWAQARGAGAAACDDAEEQAYNEAGDEEAGEAARDGSADGRRQR